ncbi:MAG: tubulin-like doman-containing protein [Pirellulaceae bacterium]
MIMRSVNSTTSAARTTVRRELREALKIIDLQPTVLIGLGGAGGEAVRRVKHQLDRRGLESHVIMRVFDTDPSAIKGSGGLPSFDDQEFCHVSMDRIPTVLDDPARHAYLTKRLGLANPEHRSFLERVLNTGIDQAGQVRQLGLLSGLTNSSLVGDRLRSALAEVTHVFRGLIAMRERENPIRLRQRTKAVVISSVCGGSGGSLFLEEIALLRSLTHNLNVGYRGPIKLLSVLKNVGLRKPRATLASLWKRLRVLNGI